ncbi:MAG: hypothetical protein PHI12_08345 [Dehalococcoidales bacterium]|nr:hypothetical protein [Dehalococcoidales bacterium]
MKKIAECSEKEMLEAVKTFATKLGVTINPEKHLANFLKRQRTVKHCACKAEREYCPCPEAQGEIQKDGHCCCWLFVDHRGLEIAMRRLAKKKAKNPGYKPS